MEGTGRLIPVFAAPIFRFGGGGGERWLIMVKRVSLTESSKTSIETSVQTRSASNRREPDHRTRVGQERSARTESRILEAALGVFADMGPEAPKIDDFVRAAGISRGTFYNHFHSVDELLAATSEWTTRALIETIDTAISGIESPVLRFGIGLRLFFAKAESDPTWSRFVARVWKLGGLDHAQRDIEQGVRLGIFSVPCTAVATDLILGAVREALARLGNGQTPPEYGTQMVDLCLRALGADRRSIAAALSHELRPLEDRKARRP